jgi:putative endonuclease
MTQSPSAGPSAGPSHSGSQSSSANQPQGRPRSRPPAQPDPMAERRRELGRFGEAYAARHLTERGMVVLDRNWRCEAGEIDLVLRDGRVLVVCEVKTRSSEAFGSPLEAVTERKAARLRRLAAHWLAEHDLRPPQVRIDLVGVLMPAGRSPVVEHVRGVG